VKRLRIEDGNPPALRWSASLLALEIPTARWPAKAPRTLGCEHALPAAHEDVQPAVSVQMPRENKRRVPQSSPQKTTTTTCEDKCMQRCPGPRIRVVTLGDLKQDCATPFYESSTPVLDFGACSWESQINRYDYLRGPKEIDEKLMCSETQLPEPARDLCIRSMEL
jgi:hypothetical protein